MAAFFPYFLGQIPLAEHRVAGDQLALQRNQIQHLQRRLVFVGLGIDRNLIEHQLRFVGIRGQQMNTRHFVTLRATQRLAVQRHRLPTCRNPPRRPTADGTLEGLTIQGGKQVVQRRTTGRNVSRKPQGQRKRLASIPTKLRDGVQTPRPGQNGHRRERQYRRQRMTPSLGITWIGYLGKRLPKRNNL